MNLKEKLLQLNVFEDNEYLDLYVSLIQSNIYTEKQKFKTQRHHIIPRCFYRLHNMDIDNSPKNIVNLLFKDHILAHCYIVMASKENEFKYQNRCALYKLVAHRDFKDIRHYIKSMNELQLAYECSREIAYKYNPMFVENYKTRHDKVCKTQEFRDNVSRGMKEYRKTHPFTEEHRKRLSQSAMGNHNFGTSDTRSIGCYCIDENGERHEFHSYKDAGIWWFDTYKPFGNHYSECVMQRKIKYSIANGKCFYGRNDKKICVDNLKWYRK